MLRGNIDVISSNRIAGWIYSDSTSVTGRKVLAFNGEQCIGAAEINLLRPDLREAGLGDGVLGFEIMVNPGAIKHSHTVHVRLDCSDFSLFDRSFYQRLATQRQGFQQLYSADEVERIHWMNRQGWLSQEQLQGLKALVSLGYYQRTFSRAELQQQSVQERAAELHASVVSTLFRREVPLETLEYETTTAYLPQTLNRDKHIEVIALFGEEFNFDVDEGAHSEGGPNQSGPLHFKNAAHQVLLVQVDCLAGVSATLADRPFQVIRAPR